MILEDSLFYLPELNDMDCHIDLQIACNAPFCVSPDLIIACAKLPLLEREQSAELTIRLVEMEEIIHLNSTYRKQNKATNVLAFPSNLPKEIELPYRLLGDVVICPEVVQKECLEQNKLDTEHWAHLVIHGVLHLLGYDHIREEDFKVMQALEIKLLARLGVSNPYILTEEEL